MDKYKDAMRGMIAGHEPDLTIMIGKKKKSVEPGEEEGGEETSLMDMLKKHIKHDEAKDQFDIEETKEEEEEEKEEDGEDGSSADEMGEKKKALLEKLMEKYRNRM